MNVIYDPDTRLVRPGQLRQNECGWPMTSSRSGRHCLVYRCEPTRCGAHIAHIADIETDLAEAYCRWLTAHGRRLPIGMTQLLTDTYDRLDTAWIRAGHVDAANFHRNQ